MAEYDIRLTRCFSSAFPALTAAEIPKADVALLMSADSLAGVTLAALIGEEFGVEMDYEELSDLGTFEAISQHLQKQTHSGVPHE